MAQASKVNPKTPPNNVSELPNIGSYFKSGLSLYYVVGYEFEKDLVMIEDCYDNKKRWMPLETLVRTRREVIKPK